MVRVRLIRLQLLSVATVYAVFLFNRTPMPVARKSEARIVSHVSCCDVWTVQGIVSLR